MNCGITTTNFFVADTYNSTSWDNLYFPLPEGKWKIHHYSENNTKVYLIGM